MGRWFDGRKNASAPARKSVILLVGFILLASLCPAAAAEKSDERKVLQNSVEAGDGLSSRARKTLFASRSKQDKGQYDAAAELMGKWVAEHGDQPHHLLYFNLAVSQLNLDRSDEALANLEKAVALEPRFARAWLRLGEAAYDQKQYARAAEAFGHGHELMPDPQPEIIYYEAVSWLLADNGRESLETLIVLLENHRDSAILDWYQALVAAASEADLTSKAWPSMDNCLVDFESDPEAWFLAYQLAAAGEDFEKAAVMLTVVGYLRPLKRNELMQLGDLYAGSGVPLQAARYYQKAVEYPEISPRPDDYLRLASAWMAAHRLDEARRVIDHAVTRTESVKLLALLGDLNYSEEKYKAARQVFHRCVELDADYGRGWLMGGYCSLELGENELARQDLREAAKFAEQEKLAKDLLNRIR